LTNDADLSILVVGALVGAAVAQNRPVIASNTPLRIFRVLTLPHISPEGVIYTSQRMNNSNEESREKISLF
jgi:hypothetical protein